MKLPSPCSFAFALLGLQLIVPILLYAEIHYRFKLTPSRLYHPQPEIVADAPRRLDPGQALPILLLIKDAHRFPIELKRVSIEIFDAPVSLRQARSGLQLVLQETEERIRSQFWWRVYHVKVDALERAPVTVNVEIHYRIDDKTYVCRNDNYIGTSHAPLETYLSSSHLPTLPGFFHGDLHYHTEATSDQVEFGAPLEAATELATAQGLSFMAATDHSYDLDDLVDDYLHNDPELRKWHTLRERIRCLNTSNREFVIVPGEEVSCGNSEGRNVHFLILNHSQFIRGSGDSAEKWLRTTPEHFIPEILAILDDQALAFAPHPAVPVPALESLLLHRGTWLMQDFTGQRLNGVQFWNGLTLGETEGFEHWRDLLLSGRHAFTIAGNDAHGNFNRFRQISFPFLTMAEGDLHTFGRCRTAVKLDNLHLQSLLDALRNGRNCITKGPLIDLTSRTDSGKIAHMGESVPAAGGMVLVEAVSSEEFGVLESVKIWRGELESKTEEVYFAKTSFPNPYLSRDELPLLGIETSCYLRAEVRCANPTMPDAQAHAMTNPIWINAG